MEFVISVAPRTKKNSNQIIQVNGRLMVVPSKAYKKYEKECKPYMPKLQAPISKPVNVCALYYMPTRRMPDLCNLHEALCDVLVKYRIVADDNAKIIVSMDGSRVLYDKENPRTEVYITEI